MNTKDLRVIKTQKAIRQALLNLLEKKNLEKITVKEICDQAMISKGTFYYHYRDIDDLFQTEIVRTFESLIDYIDDFSLLFDDPKAFISLVQEVVARHKHEVELFTKRRNPPDPPFWILPMLTEKVYASGRFERSEEMTLRLHVILQSCFFLIMHSGEDNQDLIAQIISDLTGGLLGNRDSAAKKDMKKPDPDV